MADHGKARQGLAQVVQGKPHDTGYVVFQKGLQTFLKIRVEVVRFGVSGRSKQVGASEGREGIVPAVVQGKMAMAVQSRGIQDAADLPDRSRVAVDIPEHPA
jgi:hypothetical protein